VKQIVLGSVVVALLVGCAVARAAKVKAVPASKTKAPAPSKTKTGAAAKKPGREKLVRIDIPLPKPMFIGTPKDLKSPNLEPPRKGQPPPFMAPPGTRNVAARKRVTGSDSEPVIGELAQVTDGDKEGQDGSYVELGPGKQWVQIDLGAAHTIYGVAVWHFHSQARVYRDVVVQVANDADFITNVRTVYNNDHDNSSGLGAGRQLEYIETYRGRLIRVNGVRARYVRLFSNGSTESEMNHYVEVEVYGKPVR
jgi:hypothetical protein